RLRFSVGQEQDHDLTPFRALAPTPGVLAGAAQGRAGRRLADGAHGRERLGDRRSVIGQHADLHGRVAVVRVVAARRTDRLIAEVADADADAGALGIFQKLIHRLANGVEARLLAGRIGTRARPSFEAL